MRSSAPLFLGLDLSTQQLKAILINTELTVVHETAVQFDKDLPQYDTTNGAILGPGDGEATSPVAMWLDAMDILLQRMKAAGVDFGVVLAISGAAQQHGSVYWSTHAKQALASLAPDKSLKEQLFPQAFTVHNSPIWQDSSTAEDCKRLEHIVGGPQALANLTGSRAYERFTGNQIAKIRRLHPETYAATARVSLISSFVPSLFIGEIAPIEASDASGMNLMDVITCKWNDTLLTACGGPELREKLGPEPVPGGTILGKIHPSWVQRWGFNPDCIIAPFTGDNPATVVALSAPGDAILSLGTSTTFLLSIPPSDQQPKRFTTSHLLSHPTSLKGQIAMLCYKNGALAREKIRDKFANGDWTVFNGLIQGSPAGNNGYMGLYFPLPEIIPPNIVGEYFFQYFNGVPVAITAQDVPASMHPRAILESQLLSIRSRIAAILPENSVPLQRLVVTGGSSANQTIRQLAADIFNMKVYVSTTKEAGGMGGALLAKYAWWREVNGGSGTFEEMTGDGLFGMQCVASPRAGVSAVYDGLVGVYVACEAQVVRKD
ncbi:hypothetical protein AMATHDRAFT_58377 [Amanita thiersii Skay4041]|uniref:Xylulose kinase n=1 Tax=Amanita thiersii Skay4041 TaxID=703135 RepID=A0A2A9NR91_9AGAR|nr:hypothetical protein AMATHDRAFT_58377 [Amanita thiersii Skay4041]